ncbi:hypothetical protein HDU76_014027, partial [Blyttiomyces sp. JEL0837]
IALHTNLMMGFDNSSEKSSGKKEVSRTGGNHSRNPSANKDAKSMQNKIVARLIVGPWQSAHDSGSKSDAASKMSSVHAASTTYGGQSINGPGDTLDA